MQCSCSSKCDCSVTEILSKVLANTYVLYLKTQNVHWNVTGGLFREIHLMTEEHYNNLFLAIDMIAERIRMIGERSPATFEEFSKLSCISDKLQSSTDLEMVAELLDGHKALCVVLKTAIKKIEESDDFGTLGLLGDRLNFHEKTVWMLQSTLTK